MATKGRHQPNAQGARPGLWTRGIAAAVSAALLTAPLPALSQSTGLEDLVNQNAGYAASDLPRRGYDLVRKETRGNEAWNYWWRASDSRCVRVSVKDDRVVGQGFVDAREWCNVRPSGPSSTGLEDLVYQSADNAAREMPRRGFYLSNTDSRRNEMWQYWWRPSDARCVRVSMKDQRVTGQGFVDEHDCNQRPSSAADSSGMSDGAKVAIAAAAILGVAALAHKSHENSKDRAQQSPQDVAEFDRGYRDGLYHQGFHNYNNTQDYNNGYQKGSEKRDAETSYRPSSGYHSGTARYVNVNDLIGARGSSADEAMRSRGFVGKGGYQQSGRAISTWWNASTRQCLNMAVRDGRVESLSPIAENSCL